MTTYYELIIFDSGLPERVCYSFLSYFRSLCLAIPVIILTSRNTVDDTVAGLQSGADDYMAKPFHFDELLARVQLRLRPDPQEAEVSILSHNGVKLDLLRRGASVDGGRGALAAREVG